MKIQLSEKITRNLKTRAIWELLLGLAIAIIPLIISMTPCELSARIVLIVFSITAF